LDYKTPWEVYWSEIQTNLTSMLVSSLNIFNNDLFKNVSILKNV
jgi:hypothetical protein